jgi:hypothetical protein
MARAAEVQGVQRLPPSAEQFLNEGGKLAAAIAVCSSCRLALGHQIHTTAVIAWRTTMPSKRDDSWFYETSARFFTSLWWAIIIIVVGTIAAYLTTHFL